MNNVTSNEEGQGGCSFKTTQSSCCQPAGGNGSSCCAPRGSFWGKGKTLIALIIIIAAIGVGAHSLVKEAATRTEAINPSANCSPQCSVSSIQPEAAKPGSCPTQSGAATASPPSSCCPAERPPANSKGID